MRNLAALGDVVVGCSDSSGTEGQILYSTDRGTTWRLPPVRLPGVLAGARVYAGGGGLLAFELSPSKKSFRSLRVGEPGVVL